MPFRAAIDETVEREIDFDVPDFRSVLVTFPSRELCPRTGVRNIVPLRYVAIGRKLSLRDAILFCQKIS